MPRTVAFQSDGHRRCADRIPESVQFIQRYIPEWLGHLDADDQQMIDNPIVRAEGKKSRLMIAENPAGQVVIDLAPCDEGISR